MDPAHWGPLAWTLFHTYAATYPVRPTTADVKAARTYFQDEFPTHLPCGTCLKKYHNLVRGYQNLTPAHLKSRETLFEWTFAVHNTVNMLLKKPLFDLDDARRKYKV
jgi:hypothetical protein